MIETPSPPPPQVPSPPPNPPMFMVSGKNQGSQVRPQEGFGGTVLGTTNPSNTGQKTLLGQ